MPEIDVECQNEDCAIDFDVGLEWEDCDEGSEHICTCPACGTRTIFEVGYSGPIAISERAV